MRLSKLKRPILLLGLAVLGAWALSEPVQSVRNRYVGTIEALSDLKSGKPKWYLYGLVYQDNLQAWQESMRPLGIEVVTRGCIVGTPEYEKDVAYDQQIKRSLGMKTVGPPS